MNPTILPACMRVLHALSFVLVAVSARTPVYAESYQHGASGFECPDDIAGFSRVSVDDYEPTSPGLGVACKYRLQRDLYADVYIYTAGLGAVPADIMHPTIVQLREQTLREINQFAESHGEQPRKLSAATLNVDTGRGVVAVFYDSFVIGSPNGTRNTWVWLWTARNHVMKIRMTRPPSGDDDPEKLREFYESVVRMAAN
jgi:hypothetical protein